MHGQKYGGKEFLKKQAMQRLDLFARTAAGMLAMEVEHRTLLDADTTFDTWWHEVQAIQFVVEEDWYVLPGR